eukprot:403348180
MQNFPEYWRMIDDTIQLTFNNKVNIKNAFDVDINCIDNLSALITQHKGENSWGRTGEALGAGAKIYGQLEQFQLIFSFRVDNVHMETYRMLGGLHRNGLQGETEIDLIYPQDGINDDYDENGKLKEDNDNQNSNQKKRKRVIKFNDGQGEKTLEKDEYLNVAAFDTELMIDPLFKQTTQKFDEMSLGALMTSRLNASSELMIKFDSQMPQELLNGISDIEAECEPPFNYISLINNCFINNFNISQIEEDQTNSMSQKLDNYINLQNQFIHRLVNGIEDDDADQVQQVQQDANLQMNEPLDFGQDHHQGHDIEMNQDGHQDLGQVDDVQANDDPLQDFDQGFNDDYGQPVENSNFQIDLVDNEMDLSNPLHESVYFVSQKSIFPSGQDKDDLLNCSQFSEDIGSRLPHSQSLDSSRENDHSDEDEKLGMFTGYDLNTMFESTKGSMVQSSKNSSKQRLTQFTQRNRYSQDAQFTQQDKQSEENSLKNHFALQQIRDMTMLNVKKVTFDAKQDQENIDPQQSKERVKELRKNKLQQKKETIEQKVDKTVNWFKFGTGLEGTKEGKQLNQQRKLKNHKKQIKFKHLTTQDLLKEKEKHTVPLNLNIGFQRLTQLFGRSLYIKYFLKNIDQSKQPQKHQNLDMPDNENSDEFQFDDMGMGNDQGEFDNDNNQIVELGFEDGQLADGFAANLNLGFDQRPKSMIHDMNNDLPINRFGKQDRDEIKVDLFRIQKKIDVKKLKAKLWNYIDPAVQQINAFKIHNAKNENPFYKKQNTQENDIDEQYVEGLKLSDVMNDLYGNSQIDEENVSVHSAFICLLHIANEKGLMLEPVEENDLDIFKAIRV